MLFYKLAEKIDTLPYEVAVGLGTIPAYSIYDTFHNDEYRKFKNMLQADAKDLFESSSLLNRAEKLNDSKIIHEAAELVQDAINEGKNTLKLRNKYLRNRLSKAGLGLGLAGLVGYGMSKISQQLLDNSPNLDKRPGINDTIIRNPYIVPTSINFKFQEVKK